jgi:hypothetical protein
MSFCGTDSIRERCLPITYIDSLTARVDYTLWTDFVILKNLTIMYEG